VQLEIAQRIYMDEDSFAYDETLAAAAQRAIRALIEAALA
jgi:N-formylglutamate deformylase